MKSEAMEIVKNRLILEESIRLKPYHCPAGKLTIGCGRNIEDRGITHAEAIVLLENDILMSEIELRRFTWFDGLSNVRSAAMIDMNFNLGITRFLQFTKLIQAMAVGDYLEAAHQMLNSKWANDVGKRAEKLANMIETDSTD